MRRLIIAAMIFFTLGVIGWFSPDIQPVQAQGDATWQVQYFDNLYFLGNPVLTETRDEVNLDWGTGSPGSGVPADNFTARVSTDVFFPAGSYRFYMLADDGATVTFNFQSEVIDTFYQPRPGEIISGDITVDRASVYHIQIDYRELEGEAYLYFDYESTADGVTGPDFPPQTQPGAPGGQPVPRIYWTGQYYNNPNLSGSPAAIIGQTGLTFDWGTGSPAPNVSADNFSARWNGVYTLDGGDYEVSVIADDGVRVYLDGTRIIDEWHLASGLTYTRTISPPAGPHTFTVEFFEAQGIASINFQLRDLTTPPDNATSPYNSYATITAGTLNVRTIPSVRPDNIITRVNRDETYPVVGRRDDNVWVQINLGNQTGWISNRYATTTNLENVPVTYSTEGPQPQPTPYTAFTRTEVNLRSGPSTDFPVITIMPQNINVPIVGRNLRATWWQVNYNGTIGWASATFTAIEDGADLGQVPVTN